MPVQETIPAVFLELLKVSGVASRGEVLVIGDSLVNDVYGAAGAGLNAVLVDRNAEAGRPECPGTVPSVHSVDEFMECMTNGQLVSGVDLRP